MQLCILYAMFFVDTVNTGVCVMRCENSTLYTVALNTIYVDTVHTKHIQTFLSITFLIFNRFSIRKKF